MRPLNAPGIRKLDTTSAGLLHLKLIWRRHGGHAQYRVQNILNHDIGNCKNTWSKLEKSIETQKVKLSTLLSLRRLCALRSHQVWDDVIFAPLKHTAILCFIFYHHSFSFLQLRLFPCCYCYMNHFSSSTSMTTDRNISSHLENQQNHRGGSHHLLTLWEHNNLLIFDQEGLSMIQILIDIWCDIMHLWGEFGIRCKGRPW